MKKNYYKLISKLSGLKPKVNSFDLSDFNVKFREKALDFPLPRFNKLNKTYVLIRRMLFQLEIKINKKLAGIVYYQVQQFRLTIRNYK